MIQASPEIVLTQTAADLAATVETIAKLGQAHVAANKPPLPKRGFSKTESAHYVGVSPTTFDRMVKDGMMPKPIKAYSRSLWDVQALDSAFEAISGQSADNPWD